MIGYLCAYLRYYYTPYFIVAYLNNAANEDDIIGGFEMAKAYGYQILPPRFRYSTDKYMYDKENRNIYKGVASIKFLNKGASAYLYSLKNKKYDTFIDLLSEIDNSGKINSRQIEILIRLQYFEEFGKNKRLLEIYKKFKDFNGRKTISKDKMLELNLKEEQLVGCFDRETEKQYLDINSTKLLKNIIKDIPDENIEINEQMKFEIETVGYIITKYDIDKNFCIVLEVDTKYSPKVKLYSLGSGKEVKCKISKYLFNQKIIEKGQIIKCIKFTEKYKQIKTDTGWKQSDEKEWWLNDYDLIDDLKI